MAWYAFSQFASRSFKQHVDGFSSHQAMGYLVANIILVSTLRYVLKTENECRDRGERDDRLKDMDEGVFLGDDDPRWRFQT